MVVYPFQVVLKAKIALPIFIFMLGRRVVHTVLKKNVVGSQSGWQSGNWTYPDNIVLNCLGLIE